MSTKTPHHVVLKLNVSGGFLGGVELEFVDGLNCLIGGRGAGKTTALELLRFGLGLMPDSKVHGQRHRNIENLVKGNLAGGKVTVALRTKDGMDYTAGRRPPSACSSWRRVCAYSPTPPTPLPSNPSHFTIQRRQTTRRAQLLAPIAVGRRRGKRGMRCTD